MRNFVVIDAEQRSEAWRAARLGRLTGSRAGDMLATIKSGEAAARRNLRLQLVLERLTGKSQESDYVSPAMQAGIDREADAFAAYEALTGEVVHRSGFLAHVDYMAGCSLDGHSGDYARLLSIKCRQPAAHWEFLKTSRVPADALAQMRHELWMTDALEHVYFSWNPDFPESLQSRFVIIPREGITEYADKALVFLGEVDRECEAVQTVADPVAQLRAVVA